MISRAAWLIVGLGCALGAGAAAQEPGPNPGARLGGLFAEPPQHAAPAGPEARLVEIERALDALAQRHDAAVAASAIEHGKQALRAARVAFAQGSSQAGERAQQIAWAALSLASRRLAALDAAHALGQAEQREKAANAERTRAEQTLAAAKARLAALRGGTTP